MIVFIDMYKKIIKYNFVTLISANIFQIHFHLRLYLHFQGSFYHCFLTYFGYSKYLSQSLHTT